MSATNSFEASVIALYFNGTAHADLAQNDGSSPATEFYVSLHTGDPGEAGAQNTSEAAYTGYARVAVDRDSSGFTCSGNSATNTAQISFGQCTASPGSDITHVGLGLSSSGAGTLLFSLALSNAVAMSVGATPIFPVGDLEFTAD
jgi:hypothetical protein